MDIFTTALTRVVPVPIKPANLKVKALLKEAGAGKLKEDLDHLENHEYYFAEKSTDDEKEQTLESKQEGEPDPDKTSTQTLQALDEENQQQGEQDVSESKEGVKHLDLYV